ncbi:phosphoribosylformylglycinamidine synthase subunit PurS [Salinicoccus halodurans]|uniref:Phosphoribosylformylglycinamidine synthase subunit PurS n=1 Tax=Salinicoccus halodurans TaxID=407035 RepID=A0A0F7D452_9STAP|nr:phosphoribosylformylglycinamidine synthase subunit PurS [Salinicoccus halodurans]AKG73630.1 phosphoribosylformylglycinamidine synthase [Salinicoccus halodurans]SFK53607.1 phosphoribosylformylglycinamidine synthase, purS protein [Salinicoccus halodurans]
MKKVELIVTLQPQVLDTQGEALNRAVHELGHDEISNIRVGKVLYFDIDETEESRIDEIVKSLSDRLFTNTVIETYEYTILDEVSE